MTGTKGYASLNYITQDLRLHENVYEKAYDEFGEFVLRFGEPREISVDVKKYEPLKAELQNFVGAVRKKTKPLVTGEDGFEVLKITERIMGSMNGD